MKPATIVLMCAAVALFGAVALAKLPHTLYGKRLAGQVVDASTGQPVAGAHVAYIWESGINPSGFTGHNSRTICYHAAATITDAQGRFEIAPWRKWSTYNVDVTEPTVLVYSRAYVPLQQHIQDAPVAPVTPPIERPNERYALKPFSGSTEERMNMLFWGLANRGCHYGGESQKTLYPMLKAIHGEAHGIAVTREQRETVGILATLAAKAALAPNPNGPANEAPLNRFIEENLR